MSEILAQNILPKPVQKDATATPKIPLQNQDQNQLQLPQLLPNIAEDEQPNFDLQFSLEELDDPEGDDALNKFLDQYENQLQVATIPQAQQQNLLPPANPTPKQMSTPNQMANATMNIQNVQNNPGKFMPAMYFPNSNVTINYNFTK